MRGVLPSIIELLSLLSPDNSKVQKNALLHKSYVTLVLYFSQDALCLFFLFFYLLFILAYPLLSTQVHRVYFIGKKAYGTGHLYTTP